MPRTGRLCQPSWARPVPRSPFAQEPSSQGRGRGRGRPGFIRSRQCGLRDGLLGSPVLGMSEAPFARQSLPLDPDQVPILPQGHTATRRAPQRNPAPPPSRTSLNPGPPSVSAEEGWHRTGCRGCSRLGAHSLREGQVPRTRSNSPLRSQPQDRHPSARPGESTERDEGSLG